MAPRSLAAQANEITLPHTSQKDRHSCGDYVQKLHPEMFSLQIWYYVFVREKGNEMSEWMSKAEREFFEYCEECGCPRSCEECPFKDSCKSEELFWGCGLSETADSEGFSQMTWASVRLCK